KYLHLLALSPSLQESLSAGETKNTQALAKLAQRFPDAEEQETVWERISGFRQDIQLEVIGRVEGDLDNLSELVNQATEGGLGYQIRDAVEAGDIPRATVLRVDRDQARLGVSLAGLQPPAVPSDGLLDEINGLGNERVRELRVGFELGAVLGDPEFQTRAVLS